ncbi:MAG: hypothetical protein PVF91_02595, partial [Chromatiales bacterium]
GFPYPFSTRKPKIAISGFPHFQSLGAIENGGTSLCRTQAVEKRGFFNSLLGVHQTRDRPARYGGRTAESTEQRGGTT